MRSEALKVILLAGSFVLVYLFCLTNTDIQLPSEISTNAITRLKPLKAAGHNRSKPMYPITASWFRKRYTKVEWDATLDKFQSLGGDTVWLRAVPMVIRTKEDILRDPNFPWCRSSLKVIHSIFGILLCMGWVSY